MSYASARKTIETIIANYAASKSYDVAWEGRQFTPPALTADPWLAVYILKELNGEQVTLGSNPWFRRYSSVQININTDNNKGRELSDAIAQEIADLFRGKVFADGTDTIEFYVPDLRPVGVREGRFTAVLSMPYMRTSLT